MREAYIVDAVRSPRGKKKNGTLTHIHPVDLAAQVLNGLADRHDLPKEEVDDVILGCVTQVGEQAFNAARGAVLAAGFPITVAGNTVNRVCGSGQQAINYAAMAVMSGTEELIVAGGVESMTRVPMGSDWKSATAPEGTGGPYSPELLRHHPDICPQGLSAEMIAERWALSRADVDQFALTSQRRAAAAIEEGRFRNEIIPITVSTPDGERTLAVDEHVRPDTTLEGLAGLRTVFKPDGVVTAGNSSGIVDGASALLIASADKCEALGLKPRARVRAMAVSGSDPVIMLTGPIPATRKALRRAGLTMADIDLIEINEAFASVPLACARDLEMDLSKVNVNGGAIALGHPLGATGGMLIATVLNELERRDLALGLTTMCIGYGMGITTIIERV